MKFPEPWQPVPPVRVHVPLIVLPFAVPVRVSTLLLGEVDTTLNWNWPVRLPLKFPPKAKDPLSVSPDTKQELEEIVRLVTLSVPSLFSVIEVVKVNACDPSELFVSTAVQLPLMLLEFELLEPHPMSTRAAASNNATASFFIKSVFLFGVIGSGQY